MRILLTGGSSFTGFWFARELAAQGHHVAMTFTRTRDTYEALRQRRIQALLDHCHFFWNTPFGTQTFLDVLGDKAGWDLLCLHGSYVKDYRSEHFSIVDALADNTREGQRIIEFAQRAGVHRVVFSSLRYPTWSRNSESGSCSMK